MSFSDRHHLGYRVNTSKPGRLIARFHSYYEWNRAISLPGLPVFTRYPKWCLRVRQMRDDGLLLDSSRQHTAETSDQFTSSPGDLTPAQTPRGHPPPLAVVAAGAGAEAAVNSSNAKPVSVMCHLHFLFWFCALCIQIPEGDSTKFLCPIYVLETGYCILVSLYLSLCTLRSLNKGHCKILTSHVP